MSRTKHPIRDLPDYEQRVAAARARAGWEIGDPDFAGIVLAAFLDPEEDRAALAVDMGEEPAQ